MIKAQLKGEDRVVTGLVRFSFVNVFNPRQDNNGGDDRYSLCILIPKDDQSGTIKAINKAIEAAKAKGITEKWGGKLPKKGLQLPLHDGEDKEDDYEGFENCMYLNAKSKRRPKVVDKNLNPILDEEEVYSGCYGIVSLSFFPYENSGNCGISVALDNVMKVKDGESLAGSASAESDFQGIEGLDDEDDEELSDDDL